MNIDICYDNSTNDSMQMSGKERNALIKDLIQDLKVFCTH